MGEPKLAEEKSTTVDNRTKTEKMTMKVQKGKSARCALPVAMKKAMGILPGQVWEITSVVKNKNGAVTVKFVLQK